MSVPDRVLVRHGSFSALPQELIEALNRTYFLHLLVTDPQQVIPRGKSLLSMMTHANFRASDDVHDITDQVKEVVHKAFWDEALAMLSSPLPSIQLPRLRRLYLDIHEAVAPLFPPYHSLLVALSSPLSPTTSPLHSTLTLLKDILAALRQRCAPARDHTIDDLLGSLSHPPELSTPVYTNGTSPTSIPPTPLAEFVIDKIKAILNLVDGMKADLNTFVLGSMTEAQLQGVLANDVKVRERELVLEIWGGNDIAQRCWRTWVAQVPLTSPAGYEHKGWITRLVRALESDLPVHCMLPSSLPFAPIPYINGFAHSNGLAQYPVPAHDMANHTQPPKFDELPPQLFFSTPSLLYIQNYLQAIVITAALRSLTRLPLSANPGSSGSTGSSTIHSESDFMARVWTLLKAEIDQDSADIITGTKAEPDGAGPTKLVNLADEIIRARQRVSLSTSGPGSPPAYIDPGEEARLRAAVERTLRTTDPVFLLLKKRLINAIEKQLIFIFSESASKSLSPSAGSRIPAKMQTGKDLVRERAGASLRQTLPESVFSSASQPSASHVEGSMAGVIIPGFEESVLQDAIVEVLQKIVSCVSWVDGVWADLL